MNVIFNVHPPTMTFRVDEAGIEPQWHHIEMTDDPEGFDVTPNLADQTIFTQQLFDNWDIDSSVGPGHLERLLQVPTWCLHLDRLRMNDEIRVVTLWDDFHLWEAHLRREWIDLLDPQPEVDFAIVWNPPLEERSAAGIHIIVHQLLRPVERAALATV